MSRVPCFGSRSPRDHGIFDIELGLPTRTGLQRLGDDLRYSGHGGGHTGFRHRRSHE